MKILMLSPEWSPSPVYGIGHYISEASTAIVAHGHDVHIATPTVSPAPQKNTDGRIQVHYLGEPYPFFAYNDSLQAVLDNLPLSEKLIEVWDSSGPYDVISAHSWRCAQAASLAQRLFGVPLVAVLHGTEAGRTGEKCSPEERFAAEMERWLCSRSDRVVVSTPHLSREVESLYGVPRAKIAIVQEGISASTFSTEVDIDDFREMFGEQDGETLLFAGRLRPEKGPDILLQAFAGILKKRPRAMLVMAGDGPMKEGLVRESERLGISGRMKWTGQVGPLVLGALYQVADLLVVPSRYEAGGRVICEALLHDLPVIAFRTNGLSESLPKQAKNHLRILEANDPWTLERAILDHFRGRRSEKRMSTRPLQERIGDPFDWSSASISLLEVLSSVCSVGA